ncbi:MAG: MoaD family protein [Candidatus Promineifilaceae bacterium]
MDVEIRLFATLKDLTGKERINISIDEPATIQLLLLAVEDAYPSLAQALPTVLVAVNKAYADPDARVKDGDEVALFPPVSGGADGFPHPTHFAITADEVDLALIHRRLNAPDVGAIVTFTGSVRGQTSRSGHPKMTAHLEYEAYKEMALGKMAQIAIEIWDRWPRVKGVAIIQRIGKLNIGETTTVVACAAAHRDQGAFEAARYGIDRLKEIVPVWKKEVGSDQSTWIEGDYRPSEADN